MPNLIALIGPAGSGKTTLANQLSTFRTFVRKPFAAPLKGMLANFLQNQRVDAVTIDRMLNGDLKEIENSFFCGQTPRHAMQTLGTEWRNLIHKNLWVDAWTTDVRGVLECGVDVVVDDCRFLHEAVRVCELGGQIVKITRDGYRSGWHISEYEWLDIRPDFTIRNNGPKEQMLHGLMRYMPELNVERADG